MKKEKEKEITEKVWFKRLSTIGIIIFSIGSPAYAVLYLAVDAGDSPASGFIPITSFIPSVFSSLMLFFIIRFIFYRLPPIGKMMLLPLIWITGLPGSILFLLSFGLFLCLFFC